MSLRGVGAKDRKRNLRWMRQSVVVVVDDFPSSWLRCLNCKYPVNRSFPIFINPSSLLDPSGNVYPSSSSFTLSATHRSVTLAKSKQHDDSIDLPSALSRNFRDAFTSIPTSTHMPTDDIYLSSPITLL